MDPYNSPYIIPTHSPHNPFPHSLLRTRKSCTVNLRKYSKKVNNAKAEKASKYLRALRPVQSLKQKMAPWRDVAEVWTTPPPWHIDSVQLRFRGFWTLGLNPKP